MMLFILQEDQLKELLFKALVKNKPDFVSLFFEIGVRFDPSIDYTDFHLKLYKEVSFSQIILFI